jgi:hypothetical protein
MQCVLLDALTNGQSVLQILRQSAESLRRDRIAVDNAAGIERIMSCVTGVGAKRGVEAKLVETL